MTIINLPEECFVNIMKCLTGREIVNISTVSKSWLSVTRKPSLWDRLDKSCGLTNSSKKMNVTYLIKLLGRPQFANLKYLAMPYKLTLGKSTIKQIAKACPHLEYWDMGFSRSTAGGSDADLIDAADKFTSLTGIATDMWKVS